MKGIFNLRPALRRQFAICDPDIVLDYVSNSEYDLPLNDFSEKLVILLLSGQSDQTVKALNINYMLLEKGKYTFFMKRSIKTQNQVFQITKDLRITNN